MLSVEDNAKYTEVGPGTPVGELHRRYWYPILASSMDVALNQIVPVRLLGEDLVLYRTNKECPRGLCYQHAPTLTHTRSRSAFAQMDRGMRASAAHYLTGRTTAQVVML